MPLLFIKNLIKQLRSLIADVILDVTRNILLHGIGYKDECRNWKTCVAIK